jgi:hypothetical protein
LPFNFRDGIVRKSSRLLAKWQCSLLSINILKKITYLATTEDCIKDNMDSQYTNIEKWHFTSCKNSKLAKL